MTALACPNPVAAVNASAEQAVSEARLVHALWCCYWEAYYAGHARGRDVFGFGGDYTIDLAAAARQVASEISPSLQLTDRIRIGGRVGELAAQQRSQTAKRHPELTARLREAYRKIHQERVERESRRGRRRAYGG